MDKEVETKLAEIEVQLAQLHTIIASHRALLSQHQTALYTVAQIMERGRDVETIL